MAPNANARPGSPTSVIDLTPILTVGVRDYDINITISMFEHHLQDIIDDGMEPAEYLRVCQARLHLLKAGHVGWRETMIPDVNTGHYLDAELWFTKYGFAPDMVIARINEDLTATTATETLSDTDTWSFGLESIDSLDLSELNPSVADLEAFDEADRRTAIWMQEEMEHQNALRNALNELEN